MRYLALNEVLELYRQVMARTGGAEGIHDLNGLDSAIAQPRMTFGGEELYPTIEKIILQVAAGEMKREAFTEWLRAHIVEKS